MANDQTPAQPANPPKATSPSKNIQRGVDIAWDSWHKHGNKDAAGAIADDKDSVRKPVPIPSSEK